ncbi:MAG: transporter [Burkholderiales bacterium]|nr:transporter [Burkholderiales bacterium]
MQACRKLGLGLLAGAISLSALAQDGDAKLAADALNPIANLTSVPFQLNRDHDIGPREEGKKTYLNIQPVIPFSLGADWNLISRTILPVIRQNDLAPGLGTQTGIGDITQSFFFSPKKPTESGWIWGAGPALLLPTGGEHMTADKWGAGPTAVVLKQEHGWTYGVLANHIWSFAGDGTGNGNGGVSNTYVQPFLSYTNARFTTFGVNTESNYNWKTNDWSVPLNFTVTQLLKVGEQRLTVQGGIRYWASTPDRIGPEKLGFRLAVTFLFPNR